jgi:hypothetical protein
VGDGTDGTASAHDRHRGVTATGAAVRKDRPMLLDDFLPVYDVSDSVAVVVRADVGAILAP